MSAVAAAREARQAKMREVNAGVAKMNAAEAAGQEPSPPTKVEKLPSEMIDEKQPEKVEAEPAKKDEPVKDEKPVEAKPDEHDPQTKKGLDAIDKQAKRFRDEQAAAKRAFEQEVADTRADLARMKQQIETQLTSVEDLKRQAKRDPIGLLRKLGIETEDDWEVIGRGAFPFTKAGKADPRAAEIAARTHKESSRDSELAELRQMVNDLTEQISTQSKQAEARSYVERWATEATKAIPSDRKTLIGNLHAKAPEKAKQALLEIGARLERENDNETPSHADVIAEYERTRRAELEEQGVDVDALLGAIAAPTPPKKPSPTLDPALPATGTRPINGRPTREQKLAAVTAGLRRLSVEEA